MAATATVAAIDDLLKTVYRDGLVSQVFEGSVLEKVLRKNVGVAKSTGEAVTIKHFYGRNGGVGAIGRNGTLPVAGVESFKESEVAMKTIYGSLSIDDFALEATQNKAAAVKSLLDVQMEGLKDSMKRQIARMWYGDGTGTIALVTGASTDTTIVMDTPVAGPTPTWFLEEDAYIYIDDGSAAAASGNVRKIVSIDSDTQVTVDSAVTVSDNDKVAFAQVNGSTYTTSHNLGSTDKEMMGLKGIVDDGTVLGTIQGLSRTTYPWLKAYANGNSGTNRALSETLMDTTYTEASKYGRTDLIITSPGVFNKYGALLSADRRYTNTIEYKGGFTALMYNNVAVVKDFDCPKNTMFFLDTATISIEELAPMGWMDKSGAVFYRSADHTPTYEANLRYYANLGALKPRGNAVLKDITE